MSFTVAELYPSNPILMICKKSYKISLLTLHKEVFIKENYGSINEMYEVIEKDVEQLFVLLFELIIDFKGDYDDFKKFIFSEKDFAKTGKDIQRVLAQAINLSMPLIKNHKRQKEISEIMSFKDNVQPCFAVHYDRLAKRYSYTLDQFYSLTLRQLHALLKVSDDEGYKELEILAQLNGMKMQERMQYNDISPEEEKEQDEAAQSMFERLKQEYEDNNKE